MDEHTPIWIAEYGSTGLKLMGITDGDILSISTQEDD